MLSFKSFLVESTELTPNELVKPNSKTGETRLQILAREIQNQSPLKLAKGGDVVVIDIDAALSAISNFNKRPFQLITNKGPISSSDLAKSEVFGGGFGGAGSGTKDTATNESAQCVWLQAMLDSGSNNPIEYFTDKILTAAYSKVNVDVKLDNILNIPDAWKKSSWLTAKLLIDNGFAKKGMVIHRGSALMKGIYAAKNKALKNQRLSKISDDKWNPGDIWLMSSAFKLSDLPTDSLGALNEKLKDLYNQRHLVGVSLKQVLKKPKYGEYNIENPPSISLYKFIDLALARARGNFWSSKAGILIFNEGNMQISPNTSYGSLKAELLLKAARGGSIGWTHISDYSRSVLKRTLPKNPELVKTAKKIARGDTRELNAFWNMVSSLNPAMKKEEFFTNIKTKDAVWIHSKYGVVLLAHTIKSVGGSAADDFITKLVNYAGSSMEESSVYVKVSEG
jgi:hypothetical protein